MKTKVVHSQSKTAWNVVNTILGEKYKIARCEYIVADGDEVGNTKRKFEALRHAECISDLLNKTTIL